MRVKCVNTDIVRLSSVGDLTLGKIYNTEPDESLYYQLANDDGILQWYYKERFEVVEEVVETIKIEKWEDLHGVEKGECYLNLCKITGDIAIDINKCDGEEIISIWNVCKNAKTTIATLKNYGFNVEFVEKPKISKELYHFCMAYPNWWLFVSQTNHTCLCSNMPVRKHNFWTAPTAKIITVTYLKTPFRWEDESINTNDIIKMYEKQEVEE